MLDLSEFKLTFSEEFNQRSISQSGDATVWSSIRSEWRFDQHSDIGFGRSSFVDASSGYDPFDVFGGALTITAVPDRTPYGYPRSWESGLIHSKGEFAQTYGYFEIRADFSSAPGSWDAFWLLPVEPANDLPGWQELDVVEHYGAHDSGVYSWIHTTDASDNPSIEHHVYSNNPQIVSGFHTYGMMWGPEEISFYVDGELKGSRATPSDMHGPMYLLVNLAVERNVVPTASEMTMAVDYIRVFSSDPNTTAVIQQPVSPPDGSDPGLYGASSAPPEDPVAHSGLYRGLAGDDIISGSAAVSVLRVNESWQDVRWVRGDDETHTLSGRGIGTDKFTGIDILRFDDRVELVEQPTNPSVFSETLYLGQNSDVAAAIAVGDFASGKEHFDAFGRNEGRQGNIAFDRDFYLAHHPDVAEAINRGEFASAEEHFFSFGIYEGRAPNVLFDSHWYLDENDDVAFAVREGHTTAFEHFQMFGWKEGRDPSPWLDTEHYQRSNPDVADAGVDPLTHYLQFGAFEGRVIIAADDGMWSW